MYFLIWDHPPDFWFNKWSFKNSGHFSNFSPPHILIHTYTHVCTHTYTYINILKWGHPCDAARFRMRIVHGSYSIFVETQRSPHCCCLVFEREVTLLLPTKLSLSEQVGRHPCCRMLVKFSSKALLGGREKAPLACQEAVEIMVVTQCGEGRDVMKLCGDERQAPLPFLIAAGGRRTQWSSREREGVWAAILLC